MVWPEEGNRSESGKADAGSREFAGSSPGMIGSMDSFAFVQHVFRRLAIRASRPSQDSDMPARTFPAMRRAISATLGPSRPWRVARSSQSWGVVCSAKA